MGTVYFRVKKPSGPRKSFSIQVQEGRGQPWKTVQSKDLKAINKALKKGDISVSEALPQVEALRARLYKERDRGKPKHLPNGDNKRILEKFLDEYSHRNLVDPSSAVYDYTRAVDAVGLASLRSGSRLDLQKEVDRIKSPTKQRRVVDRLNAILYWLGRDIRLKKKKAGARAIEYLTLEEMRSLTTVLPDEFTQLLFQAAFATGCRQGELFALDRKNLQDKFIWVEKQINRAGELVGLKNNKPHRAYILPEYRKALEAWLDVPRAEKLKYRNLTWSKYARRYSAKVGREITFHDIRHSYAVHLLGLGVPLAQVAQSLGDGVQVCEMYYTGFVLTDLSIDMMDRVVTRSTRKNNT